MGESNQDFDNFKKQVLESADLSRKGTVDELIAGLVAYINSLDDYVTSCSCSGRAILLCREYTEDGRKVKKDCKWLYISHESINFEEFAEKVDPSLGNLQFKYEPFILHVQCSSLERAKYLHKIAPGCGFRNSEITIGKQGKITLAIRSKLRLEVPLSEFGVILVCEVYLKLLIDQANDKMETNKMKIKHFTIILKEMMDKYYGTRQIVRNHQEEMKKKLHTKQHQMESSKHTDEAAQ